jgi:hypothetical protein
VRALSLSVLGFVLVATKAHASPSEVYWESGAAYFSSPARLVAGYGGGPGYRYYLSDSVALHIEARWLGLLGNASAVSSGGTYAFHYGAWRPAIGAQLSAYFGNQVRIVTSDSPDPVGPLAMALQARLTPIRFVVATASATVLGLDIGAGFDGGQVSPALLLSLLELGYRF